MNVIEKFLRYIKIDTQSIEGIEYVPSTDKQRNLAELLVKEMQEMGIKDIYYDKEHCYVYAHLASNMEKELPSIGFVAHMDTSDAVSGKNVNPQIIEDYKGQDIVLNHNKNIVTAVKDYEILKNYVGKTLIVTDGTTLLGGDDKAGVAEIMEMLEFFIKNPDIKHCNICVAFTPDEEVGMGTEYFDLEKFGADYAYTVDGGELGDINYENFNAASATIKIHGISVHPGTAKNIMKNAITLSYDFFSMLPSQECPECTEKYEGFYHATDIKGSVEELEVRYIIRDHDKEKFENRKERVRSIIKYLNEKYGYEAFELELHDTYYNMSEYMKKEMHLVDNAILSMEELGIKPLVTPIRGGTDGASLTYKGLCCPNLGTGSEGHHGRHEFACVESMEETVKLLVKIISKYSCC